MAGTVNLTQTQMQAAIAVLLNNFQMPPTPSVTAALLQLGGDGTLQFPDNAFNENLGQNINAFVDANGIIHLGVANAGPEAIW